MGGGDLTVIKCVKVWSLLFSEFVIDLFTHGFIIPLF